jgi:lipopolysaccharide export system protein LptC
MKDRSASLLPMAMLVLLAALTFWLSRVIEGDKPRTPQRHDPDYSVERFQVRRFDPSGKLQHTLMAQKLVHYPDDDTTLVTGPHLTYHQNAPTEITARMAHIGADGKEIDLIDEVRVLRHGASGDDVPTQLDTRSLKVFPDEERGYTRDPVTITQGRSLIRGKGMEIDNKTGISVLHGRVTGTLYSKRTEKP